MNFIGAARSEPSAWTFPLKPQEDELLSSWLTRAAHAHGTGPHSFCAQFYPGAQIWTRDIDRSVSDSLLQRVAMNSGRQVERVFDASLRHWVEVLAPNLLDKTRGQVPLLLSAGVFHRVRRRHGLQFCPVCLAEGVAFFRRTWRFAFVTTCPDHRVVLRDACPHCDAPVVPHRAPLRNISTCHLCRRSLCDGADIEGDRAAIAFETMMKSAFKAIGGPHPAPWRSEALVTLRSILSVMTARGALGLLSKRFHLTVPEPSKTRLLFETERIGVRRAMIAIAATWTNRWPDGFVEAACEAGLTQRSFCRLKAPTALADAIRQLPEGLPKRRAGWSSILNDALMKRLRRTDKAAWRQLHARRALAGRALLPG